MKTTVMGVFPREDDARRVLSQLVASTLDLDAIRVLHKEPEAQRALAAGAGLPADRSVPAGLVTGALLGGAIGFGLGLSPDLALAQAGPLFLSALGLLAGGAAGAVLGGLTDALPVPREQLPDLAESVDGGATVVLVRTDSLPTARAIRDLFQAAGSEVLAAPPGEPDALGAAAAATADAVGEPAAAMATPAADAPPPIAPAVADHPARVPAWRRLFRVRRRDDGAATPPPAGAGDAPWAAEPDHSLFRPRPESDSPELTVAPWERPARPEAEPAMYEPPQAADVTEDAAPPRRRRRKVDAAESPATEVPTAALPADEPPAAEPPTANPPATEPPATEPPAS